MAISKVILNNDVQIDITDTTASQSDVASTKYYYGADGVKKQGSYVAPSAVTQATPTISVNSSTGLITASASQSAGVVSAGTKSATEQLSTQAAQTLYPSTTDQTISSGKYLTGTQTFKGVLLTNLTAGNIKKNVVVKVGDSADDDRIASITGTYAGAASTYSVAVLLTNPILPEYFDYFNIYEQITSDGWEDIPMTGYGDQIGSISSPTGATIVKINASSYGFFCDLFGNGAGEPIRTEPICTGGVEYVGRGEGDVQVLHVTGDGIVIFDGITWDDD